MGFGGNYLCSDSLREISRPHSVGKVRSVTVEKEPVLGAVADGPIVRTSDEG
jgi:hypothetical protein